MTDARASLTADYLGQVKRKRLYGGILLILFAALMTSGWMVADGRNAGGFWSGLHRILDFPTEILSEAAQNWRNLPGLFIHYLPSLVETLNIAAVSTLFGAGLATVLAMLSTRGLALWPRLIPVFRRMMDILRAVPEIVIALVLIFILGGGPVPAMIAIALHTTGALGKLFSEVSENCDIKPVEGLESVGANWLQRVWFGIIPQVAPNWSSYALLRFEINIRASAILGFVGSGGIGYDLKTSLQWGLGKYDEVVAIFLLLFVTIMIVDHFSDRARARLVKGGRV
ncbi:MAG: phosphonate ABC transporter, permease protein PhnE [Paracoccaceae bacterium]|nr:phosphonate ABC transporter, permease protein PhnE [Paracoccaceae bacterium]